ncbi:MAG: enoyl-CoA hydratase/isomerase family protein [Bdellovibrio sp.]|nr:enoyl-CoA hydratase/isomerase family protein [Bdellovibrio sp.]
MSQTQQKAFRLENLTEKWGFKLYNLIFDLPGEKVNKLNNLVIKEFEDILSQLEQMNGKIDTLVLSSSKPGIFIAGADITMIQGMKSPEEAQEMSRYTQKLMDRFEDLPFPIVAAVNGAALGGGFEFCLACSATVMSNDPAAKVGLPEVLLGILPGMGGCVRLPRKAGIATALDCILTGKTLNGEKAWRAGMVEACLPKEDFLNSVFKWTKANLKALQVGKRLAKEPKLGGMGGVMGSLLEGNPLGKNVIFKKAKAGVLEKTKGQYPAPLEILEILKTNGISCGPKLKGSEREKTLIREAQGFGKVAATEISKNLIRLFFLTEGVKKSQGLPQGKVAQAKSVKQAAVLGAGVMGGGIAQLFAEKNIPIRMKDINNDALAKGVSQASQIFKKQAQKRRITQREYLQKLNLISPVLDYTAFQSIDLTIEAIVENMDIKKKILKELEGFVKDDTVIASNTSSLSITEIQSGLKNPSRVVGMHFFNPVSRMPLIEVIRGENTSDEAVTTVFQLSKKLGKTPIVVKDAPGFLVNRLLMPYLNEATWLLAEGAPVPEIDEAILAFGMPMGPMELVDEVGIDVGDKVAHILHHAFGARMEPSPLHAKAVQAGRLGRKVNKGIYIYDHFSKERRLDSEIYQVLGVQVQAGKITKEEIVDRCILPMINEASRCLEEQVVSHASQVDLGMIMGTGFPPFRGGLLRYADSIGIQEIVNKLKQYYEKIGPRFEPSPILIQMAEKGKNFYEV